MLEIEDLQKLISESPSGDEMEVEDIIGHRTVSVRASLTIRPSLGSNRIFDKMDRLWSNLEFLGACEPFTILRRPNRGISSKTKAPIHQRVDKEG
jgi:hypothetical protein